MLNCICLGGVAHTRNLPSPPPKKAQKNQQHFLCGDYKYVHFTHSLIWACVHKHQLNICHWLLYYGGAFTQLFTLFTFHQMFKLAACCRAVIHQSEKSSACPCLQYRHRYSYHSSLSHWFASNPRANTFNADSRHWSDVLEFTVVLLQLQQCTPWNNNSNNILYF